MKKIVLMLTLLLSTIVSANAQIATQNSNALDNISVGVTVGAYTPLDFNSIFPLNTTLGLRVQKDFSPKFGLQAEGTAILNDNHFSDLSTTVKATNVGLNSVFNLSNIIWGYKGTPRTFEVSAIGGLGWLHSWNTSDNYLTAKTGLDLALNLGKTKASSIVITPAVYWNLSGSDKIQFCKEHAQLSLSVSYVYHFKNSNGTHSFKTYDIGAMNQTIAELQAESKAKDAVIKDLENREPKVVEKVETKLANGKWYVLFAQNSAELDSNAKTTLDTVGDNLIVDIIGMASVEGDKAYNQELSQKRADAVASYLTNRGVKVKSQKGIGTAFGPVSNRIAIVKVAE